MITWFLNVQYKVFWKTEILTENQLIYFSYSRNADVHSEGRIGCFAFSIAIYSHEVGDNLPHKIWSQRSVVSYQKLLKPLFASGSDILQKTFMIPKFLCFHAFTNLGIYQIHKKEYIGSLFFPYSRLFEKSGSITH